MATRNDHIRAEDLFSAYIDKRTTADEQVFVERHVASCADCRAKLQATRSMITALKAMPPVRAPRSFVLPKEMARQPKRSVFAWYPALRLATVTAIAAFAIVFASDVLTPRVGGGLSSVTMSAPAPTALQAPAAAPLEAPQPAEPAQPAQQAAAPAPSPAPTNAAADQMPAPLAPAAGAARVVPTETPEPEADNMALMAKSAPSETLTTTMVSGYAQPTESAEATPAPETAVADQAAPEPGTVATTEAAPTVDPLRIATITLGGLVVVLLAATLIARRNA